MAERRTVVAQRRLDEARMKLARAKAGPPLELTTAERNALAVGGLDDGLIPELEGYVREGAGAVGLAMMQATERSST